MQVRHMLPTVSIFHISELYNDLNESITWIRTLGIGAEKNRVATYRKNLDKIAELWTSGRLGEYAQNGGELEIITCLLETTELVSICKGLMIFCRESALEKLKTYVSGPFSYTQEKIEISSNRARNIGFELYIESELIKSEFHIYEDSLEDIAIDYKGYLIYIECKRPQSEAAVTSNIKGALSQLKVRIQNGPANRRKLGMFALSLTKILNPDSKILLADDEQDLNSFFVKYVDKFCAKHENLWVKSKQERIIGGLAHMGLLAHNKESNMHITSSFGVALKRYNNGDPAIIIDEISRRLKNNID